MISIVKHVNQTVPVEQRKGKTVAFIESLLEPLKTTQEQFNAWKEIIRRELSYTGQTLSVERMLNDKFDPVLRRIQLVQSTSTLEYDSFIAEGNEMDYDSFIDEDEEPVYMEYVFEFESNQINGFRVRIPSTLEPKENQIIGQILKYKIATIPYELQYV